MKGILLAVIAPLAAIVLLGSPLLADDSRYPDDSFSRPQTDRWLSFETLTGVQPPGNPVQRLADYEANELRAVTRGGLPWASWRFTCRPGRGAVLCFNDRIRHLPTAVTVRIANESGRPAAFAVSMPEMPWSPDPKQQYFNWVVNGDAPVPPGEERVVRFELAGLHADKAVPGQRPMPPTSINLHVASTDPGIEYRLDLREWTVLYPDAPGVHLTALAAPPRLLPGAEAAFTIQAEGVHPDSVTDLEVRDEPHVLWRIRLDADQRKALADTGQCQVRAKTPWYLPDRALTVGLVVDGYRVAGAQPAVIHVANSSQPGFPMTERREYHGRPTAFVNGKPLCWSSYSSYDFEPGNVGEFGRAEASVITIPVAAGRHIHQVAAPTWIAPDRYDFSELDERVCMSLQANPNAWLLMRPSLSLPVFWLQQHPEAIVKVRTPQGDVAWEETGTLAASLASADWRQQQAACLRALIAHCARQPWASRVIGFMPTGEVTEEWFAWGCNDGAYGDYSPANQTGFARWCEAHDYPWRQVPEPAAQQRPGYDYYPPDDAGRQSAAYAQYSSDLSADVIAGFAKDIKEATKGRCLTGVFYAYLVQLTGEPRQHTAGQFALRRLLDCPDVDFLAGVPLHNFRDLTNGYDLYSSATESILRAGKLYFNENDLFSWLHHSIWHTLYDPADPRGAAISMHRRALADDMVHGVEAGWFSLLSSWHHDAALMAEFAKQTALQATGAQYDRTPAEEVAFVVDDTSFAWLPPETALPRAINTGLLYALGRTGAPIGVWYLRDLDRLPERIKLLVIAEATAARPEDLEKLGRVLRQGGRTVVVIGAPGAVNPVTQKTDPTAPATLTGLPLRVEAEGGPGGEALAAGGAIVCDAARLQPRCVAEGPGFMHYADGATAGLERQLPGGGRLIWCGAPPKSSELTRGWLERAGVHCYAPLNFTVHASQGLVAITAAVAGEVELAWPKSVRVRDLYDGWTAAGARFNCPFAAGQTRLFAVEVK